ncbi:MAG: tryptophan-rich sensory protein, partial [Clostridia bacterium]|nr:tryptophan-rich sensory protein [Clostridia bacterium]
GTLDQPPLSPPAWLFPVVWSILYVLMGIACYLVVVSRVSMDEKGRALKVYGLQLLFNFFWSILFFNFDLYYLTFAWILALLGLIIATTYLFYKIDKRTVYLLLPYILWVAFASYLNIGVAILN